MEIPHVSIIIPTYNEEKDLEACLKSIELQEFSRSQTEIIVVDDGSTDDTLRIAKKYKAHIFHSGAKHIERSKSIGIEQARGKYLFFMDADIRLVSRNILSVAVSTLEKDETIVGAQCYFWEYRKNHSLINRYCELFGVNDPLPFYLRRRGIRSFLDDGWIYPDTLLKDTADYFLVRFTPDRLPTLGSQGYLCRSAFIKKYTSWKPYFFHLDATKELVDQGFNTFAMLKLTVEHAYADSVYEFYNKLHRNMELFYKFRVHRTYDYNIKSPRFAVAFFQMMTLVIPFIDSMRGYMRKPDPAWFLHPALCITVPFLYGFVTLKRLGDHVWNIQ